MVYTQTVPWEHIGECGPSRERDRAAAEVELGLAQLRLASGSPPPGCHLGAMWHEHERGVDPTVGVYWDAPRSEPPSDYIARCSALLERFDDAVARDQLSDCTSKDGGAALDVLE